MTVLVCGVFFAIGALLGHLAGVLFSDIFY